jgi:predicted negative regulator of RcsB-dependent stress response
MDSIYLTEEEQLKKIREWITQYGPTILLSIALAFAISFGWRYWRGHEEQLYHQASTGYEEMVMNVIHEDHEKAKLQADYIKSKFPNTPYAMMAAFTLARLAVNANQLGEAEKQLRWIIDNTQSESLKQIASIRAARVLNAENKPKDALALLDNIKKAPYLASALMVKGDAWAALGDRLAAKNAYQQALDTIPDADSIRPLIQMRLGELAVSQTLNAMRQAAK